MLLSLVLLTVITLTAVIGMQRSTLQIKMLNNMQHHQEVFNATNDHIELGVAFLQGNISTARSTLGPLIQSSDTSLMLTDVNLGPDWVEPTGYSKHVSVVDSLELNDISDPAQASSQFLKSNPGSSTGTTQKYYFNFTSRGSDASGRITSTQEIVFNLEGPAI
jgi:hypothetical protein|tara:strand:- start:6101 stop:6589 length:489 start_codon:yes stop_codon:yes gene_type:complete